MAIAPTVSEPFMSPGSSLDRAVYPPKDYDRLFPAEINGRDVISLAVSYPLAEYQELKRRARSLVIIDHHKTTIDAIGPLQDPAVILDGKHSGCVLAWLFFFPERPVPSFLLAIEDRDIWTWQHPHSRTFLPLLDNSPRTFEEWDRFAQERYFDSLCANTEIPRFLDQQVQNIVDNILGEGNRNVIMENNVVFVCAPSILTNAVAARFLEDPAIRFVAIWRYQADRVSFGLRSADQGTDVEQVARQFGGGGHLHAAGCSVAISPSESPLTAIRKVATWQPS